MHHPIRALRPGTGGVLALALVLLARAPACAQSRPALRPQQHSLKQPATQLRPPGSNNQPGLSPDGLLAPFSGSIGGSSSFATQGGGSGGTPALSGQGPAGVAGLPNGGLGAYSALNPFNSAMTYNSLLPYAALNPYNSFAPYGGVYPYGGFGPYGASPYGGFSPFGGLPPYGAPPYAGLPYGGLPYGGLPFGGLPYGGLPIGGVSPYGGLNPYTGITSPFGGGNSGLGNINLNPQPRATNPPPAQ
jgi:5'-3' exoribonuclease 2